MTKLILAFLLTTQLTSCYRGMTEDARVTLIGDLLDKALNTEQKIDSVRKYVPIEDWENNSLDYEATLGSILLHDADSLLISMHRGKRKDSLVAIYRSINKTHTFSYPMLPLATTKWPNTLK